MDQENARREAAIQAQREEWAEQDRARRLHPTDSMYQNKYANANGNGKQHPRPRHDAERIPSRNRLQVNVPRIPPYLRATDWTCPECYRACFGKHAFCPNCKSVRPELAPKPKNGGQSRQLEQQQPSKTKDSGQSDSLDWWDWEQPFETGRRQPETRDVPRREESRSDSGGRKAPKESKKEGKPENPEWAFDLSALDKMEIRVDETPEEKGRREARKQRESRMQDDESLEDQEERQRRREERTRLKRERAREKERQKEAEGGPSPLYLPEFISVSNLADVIGVRQPQFVQRMEEMGFEDVTYNHVLDADTAGLVAAEFNFEPIFDTAVEDDLVPAPEPEDKSALPPRPPVVTIMGHVDHGKTTILDYLRNSSVAASEHGGITQHIGAFSVAMPSGKTITFLDTPGHSAFLEMRRRGADVTDIVVLVVAADDSVKPQTVEAIKHATQAKVPVVVAISKMDKEGVNPEKVKQDLAVHSINVEDYGGDVQAIGVSGKTGEGMLDLEEAIVAQSELLDHRADVNGPVEGWVLEASTKPHGRVATALVRRGTMQAGDVVVAGTTWARVRTLRNEAGAIINEAPPGIPVEIDGWREQPLAGTEILQAPDEQRAKTAVEWRLERTETQRLSEDMTAINKSRREVAGKRRQEEAEKKENEQGTRGEGEEEQQQQQQKGPKPIHVVVKADVSGSAEAVMNSVIAVGNNEVYANVLRSGVGPVGEFDIEHAATAGGLVISFNMPIEPSIYRMAEVNGVKVLDHNVIYKLVDDVKAVLSEQLAPNVSQRVLGEAEISQIFEITLKGRTKTAIAGCKVRNGVIIRSKNVRVLRGQDIIYDGKL